MIMIVIMVVGVAAVLVGTLSSSALKSARQEKSAAALAMAKEALIGRAVSDDNMPGSLPCPDTNDDGSAELLSGNVCPSNIGRLPWRTLNLPDLRDGSGERLWYALSPAFRDDDSAQPLNSDTKGTLLVYGANNVLQTQAGYSAVAVIFAPGSAISTQTRNTVAQQNNATNYLDTANGKNNSSAGGPFIAGAQAATFNDQLLYITTQDLMPLIEQRLAVEIKRALTYYYDAHNYYPWADSVTASGDYDANDGYNRGWLPKSIAASTSAAEWSGTARPPQWFFDNQWYTLIYYGVAKIYTQSPGSCDPGFCTEDTLSVDHPTNTGVRVLFFMPGTFNSALQRSATTLSDYLEDSANKDDANDRYATPASQARDRDRIYWLSSSSIWKP